MGISFHQACFLLQINIFSCHKFQLGNALESESLGKIHWNSENMQKKIMKSYNLVSFSFNNIIFNINYLNYK